MVFERDTTKYIRYDPFCLLKNKGCRTSLAKSSCLQPKENNKKNGKIETLDELYTKTNSECDQHTFDLSFLKYNRIVKTAIPRKRGEYGLFTTNKYTVDF